MKSFGNELNLGWIERLDLEDAFPELKPQNALKISAIMSLHSWEFILLPQLWKNVELADFGKQFDSITPIKFFTKNEFDKFVPNPQLDTLIPNDSGGIYMFCIKPPHINNHASYLMYIGRAQKTNTQNLRKRVKEYHNSRRIKLEKLLEFWKDFLYVKCIPIIASNKDIDKLEKKLINNFLPPCNSVIPDVTLKRAVTAFRG